MAELDVFNSRFQFSVFLTYHFYSTYSTLRNIGAECEKYVKCSNCFWFAVRMDVKLARLFPSGYDYAVAELAAIARAYRLEHTYSETTYSSPWPCCTGWATCVSTIWYNQAD